MSDKLEKRIEINLEHIKNLNPENYKLTKRFLDKKSTVKNGIKVSYSWIARLITEQTNKKFNDLKEEDLIDFFAYLNKRYKPRTFNNYRTWCKALLRYIFGKNAPDWFEDKDLWKPKKYKEKYNSKDVLTTKDVEKLVDHANTLQEELIILMLYETGARAEELLGINIGSIRPSSTNIIDVEIPNSKYKEYGDFRVITVISSVSRLREYLNRHPYKDNPDEPLFLSRNGKYERYQYPALFAMLDRVKERAQMKKAINPHVFRHTRITI